MSIQTHFFVSHELQTKIGEIENKLIGVSKEFFEIWREDIFLSLAWWFSLLLTIIPWFLWIKYRKKESSSRLLFAGFFVIIISSWLDFFGTMYGLWHYPSKILPSMPPFIPYDFCILPVFAMFLIQYKIRIHVWVKAVIYGGINAFVGEPILWMIHFYEPEHWRFFYSFPIYVIIYIMADWLSKRTSFAEL
ncbi:CBO0543 family protein [Ammoniphilus resinae]|uniref:Uncharacterized protein n=1 Tax=Ammoniphilus resinae TaxID=861532 RepID=A0ABS4GWS4_9BACL|nr:CBO0543 family protein [Ammoniphilus resinae]MBP1934729.1 hypothetical protein [Ammoniphilus resinae]